jgi:acyl-CoA reductase-like NAD-dependent aldehyde dehydrogenase
MGKPLQQSNNEVNGLFERTKGLMAMAPSVLAEEVLSEKKGLWRKIAKGIQSFWCHSHFPEPVGVVLVIAPWNYPLLTAANAIIPAILAGNSVVLKHSWRTPLVAEVLIVKFSGLTFLGIQEGL